MDGDPQPDNPAIALLTEQRDRYESDLKKLQAQLKGVEAKITSTKAKHEATAEALNALIEQLKPKK